MKVVILGCGRVGARVAATLGADHQVTVIDWNPQSFDRLAETFNGHTVVGNGIDVEVLKRAGVKRADLFLAVTDGDNRNLMAAQVAEHLGVPRVIVRVYDPVRAEIFGHMGNLETISPTITGANRLVAMALGQEEGLT